MNFNEVYRYEIDSEAETLGANIRSNVLPNYFTVFDPEASRRKGFLSSSHT